jgi:Ser/Thr protein kinase RdoA (MazF antagonist)
MEFIPEAVAADRLLEPEMWGTIGAAMARLHAEGRSSISYSITVDGALNEIARWADGLAFRSGVLRILGYLEPRLRGGTPRVIHGEINPSNVGFRTDGTVVLLDWDQAGDAATFLDHGYPLITQFVSTGSHTFHVDAARSFYDASRAEAGFDPEKIYCAGLMHALRYARFADTQERWARVCWAMDNKEELCSVFT